MIRVVLLFDLCFMSYSDLFNTLNKHLKNLSIGDCFKLLKYVKKVRIVKKEEVCLKPGDFNIDMGIVVRGSMVCSLENSKNETVYISTPEIGQPIISIEGIYKVLTGGEDANQYKERTYTITATEKSVIIVFDVDSFLRDLIYNTKLFDVYLYVVEEIFFFQQELCIMNSHNLLKSKFTWLLNMQHTNSNLQSKYYASIIGTSINSLSRLKKQLLEDEKSKSEAEKTAN
jgi:hypothetical protein